MSVYTFCPQCGTHTEQLQEGYCKDCCEGNQAALDDHNYRYDAWRRISDDDRASAIDEAMR